MKRRLQPGDIHVGFPLPYPVFDQRGFLLLRQGFIITSQKQLDSLLERGLYHGNMENTQPGTKKQPSRHETPFETFDRLQTRFKRLCEALRKQTHHDLPVLIDTFCADLQQFCARDAAVARGIIHLVHDGSYMVIHALHSAILAELFLRAMSIASEDRRSIVAAALTHDVGMGDLQEVLHRQTTPLTDTQLVELYRHPIRSVEILEDAGITDGIWLDTVLHHHERINGGGYPFGIRGEDIFFPVRVLSLVDQYAAMIKKRAYRGSLPPGDALREIFVARATDPHLAKLFIKEMGVFPPGSIVKLRNGETAVVTRHGKSPIAPLVQSIAGPRGAPYSKPIKRQTELDEFSICAFATRDLAVPLDLNLLWEYV